MFDSTAVADPLQEELARLRVDGRARSVAELVELVERCQSVVNLATALQTLAMAHLAAIEDVELEDGTVVEQHRGLGHQRLDAPALVSEQLGVSEAAACRRMALAVDVVTRAPGVFDVMGAGRLDDYRAGIVCEELRDAPPDVCREVVARLDGWLGSEPPAALRRRVRAALHAVDADLVRAKAARARASRSLRRWPGDEPGVDTWMGSFPVEQARSGWAIVDRLARQYVQEGRSSGADQARADALMDLIHSRATGTFVVQLAVPAGQVDQASVAVPPTDGPRVSAAEDEALVTVTGFGMAGATEVRRTWAESLMQGAVTAGGREVAVCHADTGAILAIVAEDDAEVRGRGCVAGPERRRRGGRRRTIESTAYRPPPALVELVKARDGRCRFPGCTVSAVFCDLDHVRPWPAGPTQATNLMCLCRRHHRVKQTVRWRVRIEPDATVTWTDPTGRRRTTLPIDFLQRHHAGSPDHADHADHADHGHLPKAGGTERPLSDCHPATPVDELGEVGEVGLLWSAWEDELAHSLATTERHDRAWGRRGAARDRPRLTLHRMYAHQGGARDTRADAAPPF